MILYNGNQTCKKLLISLYVLPLLYVLAEPAISDGGVPPVINLATHEIPIGVAQNELLQDETSAVKNNEITLRRRPLGRKQGIHLAEDPACSEDIKTLCGNDNRNNFGVLECIQNKPKTDSDFLSQRCHHLLWEYKMNLTMSGRIEDVARDVCNMELARFPQCQDVEQPGQTLTCMTMHLDELQDEKCHQYLIKLAAIVFSDYRLVSHMTKSCSEDIQKLRCGHLQPLVEPSIHSQGYVIDCLGDNTASLSPDCHQQILRLAELQADDFHLDRPLFFACRDDRENFCRNVRAGQGKVYKCLMKHKMERTMSRECGEKLAARQHLVQEDYQVSQGLAKACRSAVQTLDCRKSVREGLGHSVKLSVILLCLEDGLRRGTNIDTTCQEEMLNHRRMLLEDYHLSPDLVVACKTELKRLCGGGKELGGRTLHCLMKHARQHPKKSHPESRLTPQCMRMVEAAVKVSDAGEDWRIDPVLHEACQPVVERACPTLLGGQARVMRCLMRHLGTPIMTGPCESSLLEVQYFVARDWKLDPQLYTACYNDSIAKCHAKTNWAAQGQDSDPERGVLVLPCLFRYIYHPNPEHRISESCSEEVRRVMHERSAFVDLHPDIESACMPDLAGICSERTKPGEELLCLQENLDRLSDDCRSVVSNYTEAEAQDVQLNSLISIHCATLIPLMCEEEARQSPGEGAVMECLIQHKNAPPMRENAKCRAVVENFQIVTLKDISFTPRFKKECHQDVTRFCSKSQSKKDVVDCLSSKVRDDLLQDDRAQITRGCRAQLRMQLLQRHTSARLDPDLHRLCHKDMQAICTDVNPNMPEMMLECLRSNRKSLSTSCHEVVFVRAQEELMDPGTDPVLLGACRQMVKLRCSDTRKEDILTCLKREKDDPSFSVKCRRVIVSRMIEQNSDARLNPELMSACKMDISRHCSEAYFEVTEVKTEMNGKLIDCLQVKMSKHKLMSECAAQVIQITREGALNYRMDSQFTEVCGEEIRMLCHSEETDENNGGSGAVEECMKLSFEQGKIIKRDCMEHVAMIIETQRADLHADPLLHQACAIDDAKFCATQENGKHLACLLERLDRNHASLERQCREMLRKRREMFVQAVKVSGVTGLEDLVKEVVGSSQRNYLLIILFSIVGIIFVVGLFCGRTTRRYKLLKNR